MADGDDDGAASSPLSACSHRPQWQAWLRDRLLPVSYRPEWGSVELVRAALELVRVAVTDDASVQWLVLASESCLPVTTVAEVRVRSLRAHCARFATLFTECDSVRRRHFVLLRRL